jgi:hypothetical protein
MLKILNNNEQKMGINEQQGAVKHTLRDLRFSYGYEDKQMFQRNLQSPSTKSHHIPENK